MDKEIWKDIEGYEGLYQVSNFGRVRSWLNSQQNKRKKPKIKKTSKLNSGYLCVSLCSNCKSKTFTIHRLVAQTFIPNPNNLSQVNHINGIKTDNRVDNLEWITRSENMRHAHNMGLVTILYEMDNPNTKLTPKQIKEIRETYIPFRRGHGISAIAKKYKVAPTTIAQIIHNKTHKNNL